MENPAQTNQPPVEPKEQIIKEVKTPAKRTYDSSSKNPYIYVFAGVTLIVVLIVGFVILRDKNNDGFVTTELTVDELAELAETGNIEKNGRSLVINADTEIVGDLTVKNDLEVVGSLSLGGSLTLPEITIANSAILNSAQVNNDLNVGGNGFFGSKLTANGLISANGGLTVNGELTASSISTSNLVFSGDLSLSRHIRSSGSPVSIGSGGGVGAGGTVSGSGNDIAGTITINTGSGPSANSLANITFSNAYGKIPRVVVTGVGSATAAFDWYISRTANGFSIFAASAPPASTNFSFDYIVIE